MSGSAAVTFQACVASRHSFVRRAVKGQKNTKGAPLRTDFGLGGADIVTINQARERALEYRRISKKA